jgi:transcriptional regulator with XRE-family HTH domain
VSTALTTSAAKDLGKSLRFVRHAKDLTLRDVAKAGGLSFQYVQNLERGSRTTTSDEMFEKLSHGYGIPATVMADLLLRARVMSALERRGLDETARTFVWRGVEQRLSEQGTDLRTDLAKIVADLL